MAGIEQEAGRLQLRDLVKIYDKGSDVRAVDGVSLDIEPGEFVTLLGPSGCGKTTILRMLAGFEEVTDGQILLESFLQAAAAGALVGAVRSGASPRHVPARVLAVTSLPRTRSGKSMEIAVTRLVNGQPVTNPEVVANPESLAVVSRAVSEAHDPTRTG